MTSRQYAELKSIVEMFVWDSMYVNIGESGSNEREDILLELNEEYNRNLSDFETRNGYVSNSVLEYMENKARYNYRTYFC